VLHPRSIWKSGIPQDQIIKFRNAKGGPFNLSLPPPAHPANCNSLPEQSKRIPVAAFR
jgi:hypothetical protein